MKIISLNGRPPNFDYGLSKLNNIVYNIFSELGVEVEEINLSLTPFPPYNGNESEKFIQITDKIDKANGIIFSVGVSGFSMGWAFHHFAEHLEFNNYQHIFKDKNCLIAMAENQGRKPALDYFSNLINNCDAFDSTKIIVNTKYLANEHTFLPIKDIIEKQVEDYYRLVKQKRRFITCPQTSQKANESEKDVNEITQFFANKYTHLDKKINTVFNEELIDGQNIAPKMKTCRQLTSSLCHSFNPNYAVGMEKSIQLEISGAESFFGVITIQNGECFYSDGNIENPDVTIIVANKTWEDILKGKFTPQKAFMMGQLKVRGEFILITKFEQIFNINGKI